LFITAIRHGQEAARAIDHDLRGAVPYQEFAAEFVTIPASRDKTYLKTKWSLPSLQPASQRKNNLNIVENNYTDEEVHEQANRCLQCHISPVFDGHLCIKCNGCVDVCPTNCLSLVPLSNLNMERGAGEVRKAVDHFYGIDSSSINEDDLDNVGSAMLKDEDLCIRCGLCAEKCPTQAVTMDVMNYSFRWVG
jgi:formate hydrogenlyase subunit 6/NADH:ubiquinone oxidoreductase subunit I